MINIVDATPSNDGDWMCIQANDLKPHYVHKCNLSRAIVDLESRGFNVRATATRKAYVEYSMYSIMGRPIETVSLDVLDIKVLSRDIDIIIYELNTLFPRKFTDNTEYFKLKSSFSCILFTPEQYIIFLQELKDRREIAIKADATFMNEWKNKVDKLNEEP